MRQNFPASYESLEGISNFIELSARETGFSDQDTYNLVLAIDEACSNIIRHGYGYENRGEIEIIVNQIRKGMEIVIEDSGCAFDITKASKVKLSRSLGKRSEGGMGILFIQKFIDEIEYQRIGEKNQLKLRKHKSAYDAKKGD